jgi:hypothetical protein
MALAPTAPPRRPARLPARDRWREALAERNRQRDDIRNNKLQGTPLAKPSSVVPVPDLSTGDHMVRRGTRIVTLTRAQASETTRKSWQTRKEKYGKKGRASRRTFQKSHRRIV